MHNYNKSSDECINANNLNMFNNKIDSYLAKSRGQLSDAKCFCVRMPSGAKYWTVILLILVTKKCRKRPPIACRRRRGKCVPNTRVELRGWFPLYEPAL